MSKKTKKVTVGERIAMQALGIIPGGYKSHVQANHRRTLARKIDAAIQRAESDGRESGRADYRYHLTDIQTTGLVVVCREGEPTRLGAPKGHILTDDGTVRKVLGSIEAHTTKDGAIALVDAEVFHPDALDLMPVRVYSEDGTPEVDVPTKRGSDNFICQSFRCDVKDCYSTRSAAESSRTKGGSDE